MLDQITRLWAAEFGHQELVVKDLLRRASKPLLVMLRRVAPDPNDRDQINARRIWLSENRGRAAGGWKFECRVLHKQLAWRIVEAPFDVDPVPSRVTVIPEGYMLVPVERPDLSPAEKLEANLSTALDRQAEVMALGVDPDNLKATRLVAETAATTVNAALKAQEAVLRQKREDEIMPRLMQALAEEREKLRAAGDCVESPRDPKQDALLKARLPHLFGAEAAAKALAELSDEDRAEVMREVERRR
jgi:hypothetical protein